MGRRTVPVLTVLAAMMTMANSVAVNVMTPRRGHKMGCCPEALVRKESSSRDAPIPVLVTVQMDTGNFPNTPFSPPP